MPTFSSMPAKETKKVKRQRRSKEPEIDYRNIPGIVILNNDNELYNWTVYGTKTAPRGK